MRRLLCAAAGFAVLVLAACSSSDSAAPAVDTASLTDEQRITMALSQGDTDIVAQALDANPALINQPVFSRQTLLHHAVRFGNIDSIRFLLDRGADPNVPSQDGDSTLDYAYENGVSAEIKDLLAGKQ